VYPGVTPACRRSADDEQGKTKKECSAPHDYPRSQISYHRLGPWVSAGSPSQSKAGARVRIRPGRGMCGGGRRGKRITISYPILSMPRFIRQAQPHDHGTSSFVLSWTGITSVGKSDIERIRPLPSLRGTIKLNKQPELVLCASSDGWPRSAPPFRRPPTEEADTSHAWRCRCRCSLLALVVGRP
jgi:hypothetical protein